MPHDPCGRICLSKDSFPVISNHRVSCCVTFPPPSHGKASLVAPLVKNLPANTGDARDMGSIFGLGGSPAE